MSTRIAIVADVHADARALDHALARIEADLVLCAGDLVDYGLEPERTLALLRERGIPCIRGNHDRWALGSPGSLERAERDLLPESVSFLRALPRSWSDEIEGVKVAMHHGRTGSDMRGIYPLHVGREELDAELDAAKAEVLIVGHTHLPLVLSSGDRSIVNPGALLREPKPRLADKRLLFDADRRRFVPGPGPGGGTYGILELPSKRFRIHRAADGSPVREIRVDFRSAPGAG